MLPLNQEKYPFCLKGHNYALEVISGKVVANKYIVGACKRYLRDLDDEIKGWHFSWDVAEHYLRSVQKFEHVIGHWTTPNIVFEPWQCWLWMNIMGFINKSNGFRRFRIAHIEVARGNAKSAMASQALLYFLALDKPNGNQISTVATKKDQARIVFDSAKAMAMKSDSYRKHTGVNVLAHVILHRKSNSVARPLAAEHKGLDGLNDILAICDELHAMDRDVFEVITSGMSKRADSLTLCITTAGQDVHSVGYTQSAFAKKVALDEFQDETFFAAVYCLEEEDDWTEEKNWIKANPNLGVSVDVSTLRSKVEKAIVTPSDIPNIKIKHMNLWISEAKAFYDPTIWDKCYNPKLKLEDFKNKDCYMALDLASHIDITSRVAIFHENGKFQFFSKNYLPEDTLKNTKNALYTECVEKGFLISTPGAAINYDRIRDDAEEFSKNHRVKQCLYDPWNATESAQKLSNKIEMVKISMNVANLSEPMKKFDALMREGKFEHDGSPLVRWCLSNVVAKEDHNGNVFPRKSHEKLKIDIAVAGIMALAGWLQEDNSDSVYEDRGLRTLGGGKR